MSERPALEPVAGEFVRHDPLEVIEPRGEPLPILFDSPHSGTLYPDDFGHAVDPFLLRGGEDRFVDDLIVDAPSHGITVMRALFARTYIDPNRPVADLDPDILADDWPDPVEAGLHSGRGVGLIFRLIGEAVPIYRRRLSRAEVDHRIETYWRRYHECLDDRLSGMIARHGVAWHVNWHSMLPVGNALSPDPGRKRSDFTLGDLHGKGCAGEFTAFVAETLRDLGYSVSINDPYAGTYIVERYGRPGEGRHTLQVEINRALYMDLATLEPGPGMPVLRRSIAAFSARLAAWANEHSGMPGS